MEDEAGVITDVGERSPGGAVGAKAVRPGLSGKGGGRDSDYR